LYAPWHQVNEYRPAILTSRDLPLGHHFLWEYAQMGINAHPAYALMLIEQVGIFFAFAGIYKLALILYDLVA
jgi:hypothetical protein